MHARRFLVAAVAAMTVAGLTMAGSAGADTAPKPGQDGPVITLERHLNITQNTTGIVTTSDGTAVAAWLGSEPGGIRMVYACVLPLGAKACKGGVQSVPSGADDIEASTAADLKLILVNNTPTLLWLHNTDSAAEIALATVSSAGVLTPAGDVAPGPRNGDLLDAEPGPNSTIWTITYAGLPAKHIEVHAGLTAAGTSIDTSFSVGHALVAFDHSQPVIVATDCCTIGAPGAFSTSKGSGYTAMKKIKHTWGLGQNPGLVETSSGLRLYTGIDNANYTPVVAKWTGSDFGDPKAIGDKSPCTPDDRDSSTDRSGRVVDAGNECGTITVDNLPDTTHAGIFRFKAGGTVSGDRVQVTSSPRGHAWVMWGIEDTVAGGNGTKLMIMPLLLPDTHVTKSKHGKHGKVSVTGPASCLPADTISVGVSGNPDKGWKVSDKSLTLDGNPVHGDIDGSSLTPGKKYTLKGTVDFTKGTAHSSGHAKVKFKACPNP